MVLPQSAVHEVSAAVSITPSFRLTVADAVAAMKKIRRGLRRHKKHPEWAHIRLVAEGQHLRVSTMDESRFVLTTEIPAEVEVEGLVVLNGHQFERILALCPAEQVSVAVDHQQVTLQSGRCTLQLQAGTAIDEPPAQDVTAVFELPGSVLKAALQRTLFAAAPAKEERRPVLQGACFALRGNTFTVLACDGVRIARYQAPVENPGDLGFAIALPGPALREVMRLTPKTDDPVGLYIDVAGRRIAFDFGGVILSTQFFADAYPDVLRLVDHQFPTAVTFDRQALMALCQRALLIGGDASCRFTFQDGMVVAEAKTMVGNTFREEFPVTYTAQKAQVPFNARFLVEALKTCPENEVVFEIPTSPRAPFRLSAGDSFRYWVLPLIGF